MKKQKPTVQSNNSIVYKQNASLYHLSNEDFLKRTLRLLGVKDQLFQKETKTSLRKDLFPKTLPNPTNSKQFFFICFICAKNLFQDEVSELSMWYPPRNVNQQIQFKKVFFKLLQKCQSQSKAPKKLLISRMSLMGDTGGQTVIQFLRIISELSLRTAYLRKYSKDDKLIQIAINNFPSICQAAKVTQNDINKFYVFPFNETVTNVESPISSELDLESIKRTFKIHIENYRKLILSLRTTEESSGINPQILMSQILQQKQLANTLTSKVNKTIYTQNRAFDRRVIIEKHQHIWKDFNSINCNYAESGEQGVLKASGETDKKLKNWRVVTGVNNLNELVGQNQRISELRKKCLENMQELNKIKELLMSKMRL